MICTTCKGAGLVLADLRKFRFGEGFNAFVRAGLKPVYGDDGSVRHEIVCPRCDGSGEEPQKEGE